MNRRIFLAAIGVLGAAGCSTGHADKLVIGMELGYPPFEMKDAEGKPTGVSVDLAEALARSLGREPAIENLAFDGLIPALKTGTIDLIVSSLTRTEERARSIDFSEPYLETGLCLLAGKNAPVGSAADLDAPGRTVAVKKGTTGHAYAAEHLKRATLLVLDQEAAAVLEVVQGKADAFIYDQLSVFRHARRHPDTTRALLQPFRTERWAIGIRKGRPELVAEVNRFLAEFRRTGGFDRLGDRWLREPKEGFKSLGIPFVF